MTHLPDVPRGTASTRAGDADRERLAEILRAHWEAGRLSEEELEDRLGRVYAARTLGQLRRLVRDLPSAPPSVWKRLGVVLARRSRARPARPRGRARRWVALAFVLLVVASIVGSATDSRRGSRPPAPRQPSPSFSASQDPQFHVTRVPEHRAGVDGRMSLTVTGARTVSRVPLGGGEGTSLAAGTGHALAVVDVEEVNDGSRPADAFCGSNGAKLSTREGRTYEPVRQLNDLAGNDAVCRGGIAPGESARVHLAFRIPKGTRPARLDLWNADEPGDILGDHTRLRVGL